jgi:triosephosphate isomerase
VGESELQRKKGEAVKIVRAQVAAAIANLKGDSPAPAMIAYEPVWAIGTGKACTTQDAHHMHEAIRDTLIKKFRKAGQEIRILYGGSVDPRNVADYLSTTYIDGVLVGGASLDPRTFGLLCRSAISG